MYGTSDAPWLIEAIVSILMKVLRWSRTISHLFLRICCMVDDIVHFIRMRGCINNYPHPVCGNDRYQFKKKIHLYMIALFSIQFIHLSTILKVILHIKGRNWRIGRDRTFISLPTHQFASPKLYLFLFTHLSRVTGNIYLFISLCLVIFIFSYPLVYLPTEVLSIFFYLFLYLSWSITCFSFYPSFISP